MEQTYCYRKLLQEWFSEKIHRNQRFSLRAAARQLGLTPSYFSEVMNGHKNLSVSRATELSYQLGFAEKKRQYFCLLVQIANAPSPSSKNRLLDQLDQLNPVKAGITDISLEAFKVISDWYYIPIIEMTQLEGFVFTPQNVAKKLGLKSIVAEAAIDRLVRLNLIGQNEQGRYCKTYQQGKISSKNKSIALRTYHKQMLKLALQSLEEQSAEEKVVGTQTICFDQQNLPEAQEIIEDFFESMIKLSKKTQAKSVYHLSTQFFKITGQKNKYSGDIK